MKNLMPSLLGLLAFGLSASAFAGDDGAIAVPEPGTFGLLIAGIAVVAAIRLRGRK